MKKSNGDFREALQMLPTLPEHEDIGGDCRMIEFKLKKGSCIATCIFENEQINISRVVSTKGTVFEPHVHRDVVEYIIMESGKAELTFTESGDKVEINGGAITVPPNTLHTVEFLADSISIAITRPPDPDFPHMQ